MNQKEAFAAKLKASWPSPFVARREVGKFSGGLLHPRTLANIDSDCNRLGPPKIKLNGRGVAYDRDGLIDWLLDRMNFNELAEAGRLR